MAVNKSFQAGAWVLMGCLLFFSVSSLAEPNASLDKIINQIESMFPPTEGYVISVEKDHVILDLKQGEPIREGDRLKLIRFGDEIVHPVTRKKIGHKETDLGEIEIMEIRKDFSLARVIDSKAAAQAGDGVRTAFKKLSFLVAPPAVVSKEKIDKDRLRLEL